MGRGRGRGGAGGCRMLLGAGGGCRGIGGLGLSGRRLLWRVGGLVVRAVRLLLLELQRLEIGWLCCLLGFVLSRSMVRLRCFSR